MPRHASHVPRSSQVISLKENEVDSSPPDIAQFTNVWHCSLVHRYSEVLN